MIAIGLATVLAVTAAQTDAAPLPPVKMRSAQPLPSLVSAETLGVGGSAALVTAGFPFVGAAWAQGFTPTVDAGAAVDLDLALTELFAGPTVRISLAHRGATSVALVGRAGFYADLGADWAVSRNRSNSGVQLSPGIAASARSRGGGIVTGVLELPITATLRDAGSVIEPTARVVYEAPFYGDFTIGARVGTSIRAASGGAPLADRDARFSVELGALLTYRLF